MQFVLNKIGETIAVISCDRLASEKPTASSKSLSQLESILDECIRLNLDGIIFSSQHTNHFLVGFDLEEIAAISDIATARSLSHKMQCVLNRIDKMPCPTVAAVSGQCFGFGLELALACRYRVGSDRVGTLFGFPEVHLGLIPGAGGTQRLPKLVGTQNSLEMILTGKKLSAVQALEINLLTAISSQSDLHATALDLLSRTSEEVPVAKVAVLRRFLEHSFIGKRLMMAKARNLVDQRTKGFYPAPYKAIHAIFRGLDKRLEKGLKLEAKYFSQLLMTRECKNLLHLFHSSHAISRTNQHVNQTTNVSLLGAGLMGSGIATICAQHGIRVQILDPNQDALAQSLKHSRKFLDKKVAKGRVCPEQRDRILERISTTTDKLKLRPGNVTIEAVFEDLSLKQSLLQSLEELALDDWIFASNTSAIPIAEIAKVAKDPSRVIGMHFFSPAEKMPLVEIITTSQTAPWVCDRAVELGLRLKKKVILVKDSPGFFTTRVLAAFLNEAVRMTMEGVKIDKLDKALTDFGFPVGPLTLIDEIGFDIATHVTWRMTAAFPEQIPEAAGLNILLTSGRLGRKNQKGFYEYEKEGRLFPAKGVYESLKQFRTEPRGIPADEIVDRCLMVFVNECVRCLEESIIKDPHTGDIGSVYGLGFPPFLGGPFKYIDQLGAATIVERLDGLSEKYGPHFRPTQLLRDYAKTNQLFFFK